MVLAWGRVAYGLAFSLVEPQAKKCFRIPFPTLVGFVGLGEQDLFGDSDRIDYSRTDAWLKTHFKVRRRWFR